mgnify:CR=1 FL=1
MLLLVLQGKASRFRLRDSRNAQTIDSFAFAVGHFVASSLRCSDNLDAAGPRGRLSSSLHDWSSFGTKHHGHCWHPNSGRYYKSF